MNEKQIREKVVSIAKKYYGCKESDGSHRQIIDGYNTFGNLPRGYKVTYNDAWCATFVSFIAIKAGLTDIMPRECGCGAMLQLYQKLGRWIENDAYVPKIGDIVMYDWDDAGNDDCKGYPEHVGIVIAINGTSMKIIEGNKNHAVGYRNLSVNSRYIRGYCIPDYASKATTAPTNQRTDYATSFLESIAGTYETTANLNFRIGAGTKKNIICVIPKGNKVTCYGYYTPVNGTNWYLVSYKTLTGFVSSKYLAGHYKKSNEVNKI